MNDQLQEYTLKLVTLGQETLRVRRRGEWLPDSLAALVDELLALEATFGAPAVPPAAEMPLEEPFPPIPATEEDIDDWPTQPVGAPAAPAGDLAGDVEPFPGDAVLIVDVDEEPAAESEPASGSTSEATAEEVAGVDDQPWLAEWSEPESFTSEPTAADDWLMPDVPDVEESAARPEPKPPAPAATAVEEVRFCINCGEKLRPGKRFCHRCGAPVSEMLSESVGERPGPAVVPAEAPAVYAPAAPPSSSTEIVRFCNNCGLGLAAGITVCPDCGSRDIS
jgi:hypothetical protein